MSAIVERYSRGIAHGTDTDCMAAFGLAAKRLPLGVALHRLIAGDGGASDAVIGHLSIMAADRGARTGVVLAETQAVDMARAALAWHRHSTCKACNGHGYLPMAGAPALSDVECPSCRGTGKIPFDRQFPHQLRSLASWLMSRVEHELSSAGPIAMALLAPRLDM